MENDILKMRRRQYLLFIAVIGVFVFLSARLTDFSFVKALLSIPRSVKWLAVNFIPDLKALAKLPDILKKLFETVFVSIIATILASFFSFFFAIMGARTTRLNRVFSVISRAVALFNRNIPVAAWAMIFLFSFGQSMFTGFLALFFVSFGFLTRVFIEAVDEASGCSVEALRASGATYLQTIFQAVLPASIPQIVSWILFMIETNIRSATLVGILTGTGIGFMFNLYYRSMNYKTAGLIVVCVVAVVLLIETISNYIRKVIL